jgi:phage portal protein BeeE
VSLSFDPISRKFAPAEKKSGAWRDWLAGGLEPGATAGHLHEAFKNSPWVMRAIKFCSDPIAAVDLEMFTDRKGGEVPLDLPEAKQFWNKPGVNLRGRMSGGDFFRATAGWLKLQGEAFWILDDSWFARRPLARRSPLAIARPGDMEPVCGDMGEVIGWKWTRQGAKGGAAVEVLTPENVVHLACWNPYDQLRGLAEWEAAKISAEADYFASRFAKNLMENNGDRGPIVTGEGAASDEQIAQITRILREKRERNKRGEFVPAFLVGSGLNVTDPSVQAVDAAFMAQRMANKHEIFLAFGVPPSFSEVTASYSIGSASDRYRLIEETCKPLAEMIASGVEEVMNGVRSMEGGWLRMPVVEREVFADFNFDEHSTMVEVRTERVKSGSELVDRGVPWKVAGEYLGLKLPRFAGDDVGRVPFNLTEIGGSEEAAEVAEVGKARDTVAELGALFHQRAFQAKAQEDSKAKEEKEKIDFERAELWRKLNAYRKPWEKMFAKKFSALLMKARSQTLAKLGVLDEKSLQKAGAIDLVFDLPEWLEEFLETMMQISRSARDAAAIELWVEELMREDDPAELPAANTLRFLRQRRNMLADTAEDIHQGILGTLEEGLNNGETMDELAERTRSAFNGINKTRAEAIATTETTVAYESARQETFEAAGVEFKEWLTSGLPNVRLTHFRANETVVGIKDTFKVGGFNLAHPGDPNGPPQEVIRCNCIMIASTGPATQDNEGGEDDE